jgi:hypothetical protein
MCPFKGEECSLLYLVLTSKWEVSMLPDQHAALCGCECRPLAAYYDFDLELRHWLERKYVLCKLILQILSIVRNHGATIREELLGNRSCAKYFMYFILLELIGQMLLFILHS